LPSDPEKSLIGTSIGHFLNDGGNAVFPIIYPILITSFAYSKLSIGILGAILSVSSIIASPLIGRSSDYSRGYLRLLPFGLIMIAIGIAGVAVSIPYVPNTLLFAVLIVFSLIAGFGGSFYHPLGSAVLNETWPVNGRGRAMGLNGSMGALGLLLFPIVTVELIVRFGMASVSFLALVVVVLSAILYLVMRNVAVLQRVSRQTTSDDSSVETRKAGVPLRIVLPTVLALTLSAFFRNVLSAGVIQFLPTYLTTVDKVSYSNVGFAVAAYSVAGLIGQPVFGSLSDRVGRRLLLGATSLGVVGAVLLLVFVSSNFWLAELSLVLFGLCFYTGFPLLLGLANVIAPKGATTLSNSIVWGLGTVSGAAVGPLIVGVLSGSAYLGSLSGAFVVLAGLGVIAVVFIPFIPKPRQM
jgi:MFS family permease